MDFGYFFNHEKAVFDYESMLLTFCHKILYSVENGGHDCCSDGEAEEIWSKNIKAETKLTQRFQNYALFF